MTFSEHRIVSRVETPELGSWLLMKPRTDGFTRQMWARVTASDMHVIVIGDWSPIVFAFHDGTPREKIAWIGGHPKLDHYVIEKADIGSRPYPVLAWDQQDAKDDLRSRLKDLREELEDEDIREKTRVGSLGWEVSMLDSIVASWGPRHCYVDQDEFCNHIESHLYQSCHDWIGGLGMRPSSHLEFAFGAVKHLHGLLCKEEHDKAATLLV